MNRTCKPLIQALLAGTALTHPVALLAGELPYGASAVQGGVAIATPSANQMTIQQTTPSAIVNWQGFSVGAGARVDISQPSAASALLNRVTGSAPSTIAGQINANGQVYLVNPNGIAITPTGTVQAGGFVASTLDISDQDFASGRRVFRGTGQSAAVSNQGTIAIRNGGYAALLGGSVENSGVISVPMGRVGLGAGEQATLDLSGDGFLQVAVPSKGDGSDTALIRHSGRISATGGRVEIQAATAREAARNAINLSGLVEARSVSGRNGAIVLGGGEGGTVTVTGRLNASARGSTRQAAPAMRGGTITVTGNDIRLAGATLRADGTAGGGTIRVGGGFQGQGPLQRAATTTVDAATTISANAGRTGNGGDIVVWSDRFTDFAGRISATGGREGGDGGQVEVSGKAVLAYSGTTILTAEKGAFGTLLLDPYNVTISSGADANQSGFTATGNDSVISATTLQNALQTANVTVTTGGAGSPGSQAGDITVAAPVTWGTGTGGAATILTLSAYRSIAVNANLTVQGSGGLALNTNQGGTGGSLSFGPGASASFTGTVAQPTDRTLTINSLAYTILTSQQQLAAALGNSATAGGRYALATDVDVTGIPFNRPLNTTAAGADIPFTGTFNGLGHTINGLTITSSNQNVGLFGVVNGGTIESLNLANVNIRSTYAGTSFSYVGGLAGQTNNATILGVSVSGTVAGSTSATASTTGTGGLIGAAGGTVRLSSANVAVTGGTSTGSSSTGGLIGSNGATVSQSFATGAVAGTSSNTGFNDVGGLIGTQNGTVTQSYATGTVTGGTSSATGSAGTAGVGSFTGGLAGFSSGTISQSYASGQVTGGTASTSNAYTGGLIGYNSGSATQAYATGAVRGGTSSNVYTGGLNGYNTGSVSQAYAVGAVTAGTGTSLNQTGGLFGFGSGATVTASFWDTTTTGQSAAAGDAATPSGTTGLTTAQFQDPANFVPLASGQGWNFDTVWAPPSAGAYPQLYSLPRTTSTTPPIPQDPAAAASLIASAAVTPNTTTFLPTFSTAALALPDAVDLLTIGGGGPSIGSAQGSQAGSASQTRAGAQNTLAAVQRAADALEAQVAACDRSNSAGLRGSTTCYGNALDGFADTLDIQVQQLPPAFRSLPAVIRQAAARVRTATTAAEARAAVRTAVVEVRKAISLLRADEPAVTRIQVRQGNAIASALRTVETRLARAEGL